MKTYVKFIIGAAASVLVFFILSSNLGNEQEISAGKAKELSQSIKKIKVSEMHLPLRNSEKRKTPITHVILHFTSNVTGNQNDPYRLDDIQRIFVEYGVSTHYLIDREGVIYELVPEERVAYHAGGGSLALFPSYKDQLNAHSIGIELLAIGTEEEMADSIDEETYQSINPSHIGYTDAQYASLKGLLNNLHARYPAIKQNREHVVGHDEYAPDRKSDPGSLFDWNRIDY